MMHRLFESRQVMSWRVRHEPCQRCGVARQDHLQVYTTAHRSDIIRICPTSIFMSAKSAPAPTQLVLPFDEYQMGLSF